MPIFSETTDLPASIIVNLPCQFVENWFVLHTGHSFPSTNILHFLHTFFFILFLAFLFILLLFLLLLFALDSFFFCFLFNPFEFSKSRLPHCKPKFWIKHIFE